MEGRLATVSACLHTMVYVYHLAFQADSNNFTDISQPITDVTSNDIVCNGGPNPTTKTSTVITVQAGSQATLTWRHTLTSGPSDVIDSSHKGPVMAYLKKVSDAKTDSGIGNGWFKVLPRPLPFPCVCSH